MSTPPDPPVSTARLVALTVAIGVARLVLAHLLGPSDGELVAWASGSLPLPPPVPAGLVMLMAPLTAIFGASTWALRLPFVLLSLVPLWLVGRKPVAVGLAAALPVLTVPGALATAAAPMAAGWLGALAWAPTHPIAAGALSGALAWLHPAGALVALPAAAASPQRVKLLAGAFLVGVLAVPGLPLSTAGPLTGELSRGGLLVAALGLGGGLVLPAALLAWPRSPYAIAVVLGTVVIIAVDAPAPLLAGPLACAIVVIAPATRSEHRAAWPAVGISAVVSLAVVASHIASVAPGPLDPRPRYVRAPDLASAVEAWDFPHVYAVVPADIARLRWHGIPATSPPPVHPLDLPDRIVLVLPHTADPDLPHHLGWDHERDGPHTITARVDSPTGTGRVGAAWTLSAWQRPERDW